MKSDSKIRIFCVDDHPLMREGIAAVINHEPDMQVIGEASTGREAIENFPRLQPDVTLMDVRLPDIGGIDAMIAIRTESSRARFLMLTTFEGDVEIHRALAAGARGYMLKSMPRKEILEAIRRVHAGKKHVPLEVAAQLAQYLGSEMLSEREIEVLQKVAGGNKNSEIAAQLFISEETVKGHVKHIMDKLDASDRTDAVAIGLRRGIIRL